MTQIQYFPQQECAPALYISEPLARQALENGITSLQVNRQALNTTMELASGGHRLKNLGQIVLHNSSDPERIGDFGDLVYVDPRLALEACMEIPPTRYDLLHVYTPSIIGRLDVYNRIPQQDQLTKSVYQAAYNSIPNPIYLRSTSDRSIGALIGGVLGTAYESAGNLSDNLISVQELTNSNDGLKSAGILGLVAGFLLLGKAVSAVQEYRHLKKLRDTPPIRVTV